MNNQTVETVNTFLATWSNMLVAYSPNILMAILTLVIGFWLSNKLAAGLKNMLTKRGIDENVVPFLTTLVSVLIKVLVVVSVAEKFGFKTTSFIALLGGAGLAVGMAMQGSLGHIASGLMLLIFKPYKKGDVVTIGDYTGIVREIGVFETVIITWENKRVHIPNGEVTSGPITNVSGEGKMRADMIFVVDGNEDFDKVREAIKAVADRSPLILKEPGVQVHFRTDDMDKHTIDVWPWCDPAKYFDAFYYMQEEVRKEFKVRGIKGNVPDMNISVTQK